jgi:predicted nuclease of restriction endonuclease-like (RecB) superfamily
LEVRTPAFVIVATIGNNMGGNRMSENQNGIMDSRLYDNVREVLEMARSKAYAAVNFAMVEAYWNIGRLIADTIGEDARSEYGKHLMKYLSERLTLDFGKGFDERNLRNMRQFYLTFPIRNALRTELSWTHYRMIMKVENQNAREYYLEESSKGIWSTRQLERQINSFCYERVLSSKNCDAVRDEIIRKEPGKTPLDVVKDPYVLEFLGLRQNDDLYETQLEKALLTHIKSFYWSLGEGSPLKHVKNESLLMANTIILTLFFIIIF